MAAWSITGTDFVKAGGVPPSAGGRPLVAAVVISLAMHGAAFAAFSLFDLGSQSAGAFVAYEATFGVVAAAGLDEAARPVPADEALASPQAPDASSAPSATAEDWPAEPVTAVPPPAPAEAPPSRTAATPDELGLAEPVEVVEPQEQVLREVEAAPQPEPERRKRAQAVPAQAKPAAPVRAAEERTPPPAPVQVTAAPEPGDKAEGAVAGPGKRDSAPAAGARADRGADGTTQKAAIPVVTDPRFRRQPSPASYPRRAVTTGQEGVVVVRALVNPDGGTDELVVWRSSGFGLLDDAAIAAVRKWAFEPARLGGRAVAAWVEVPVRFELK